NDPGTTVSKFPPGSTDPIPLTSRELSGPTALAVDAQGNLYVANTGASNDPGTTVSVFGPDDSAKAPLTGLDAPVALAFDPRGNLFVADANTVSMFKPGATTASATLSGLSAPSALAFDAAGNLFVANALGNTVSKFVLEYDADGNLLPS